MKTMIKSAIAAVALSVLGAGAALAADVCCCKDMEAKMACCDKAADASPDAGAPQMQRQP